MARERYRNRVKVPKAVIERLPRYVRALKLLQEAGTEEVSSQEMGDRLQLSPAQIRKDLSYFGRFGKQGLGYNVERLLKELKSTGKVDNRTYRDLYTKSKSGYFRSKSHVMIYLERNSLLKKETK